MLSLSRTWCASGPCIVVRCTETSRIAQDEIFHVGQAQTYCRGQWTTWDPKLTTPPGLFGLSSPPPLSLLTRSVKQLSPLSRPRLLPTSSNMLHCISSRSERAPSSGAAAPLGRSTRDSPPSRLSWKNAARERPSFQRGSVHRLLPARLLLRVPLLHGRRKLDHGFAGISIGSS